MPVLLLIAVFVSLLLFYTLLAIIAHKKIKTTSDYFLAGRNLGVMPVTLTLIATQLGGGLLLGTSQEAYQVGIYGILYTVGMTIGFLLLGSGLASKLQSLNVTTTAELFETHYHSPKLKKIASLLSIVTLCGILIAQVVASKSIILILNIESDLLFILYWLFIIGYTMLGGLTAVVIMDVLQVLFIIAIFGSIFLYAIFTEPVSFFDLLHTAQKDIFSNLTLSPHLIIATIAMPALFSCIEQDLAQRFFAARTKKIAAISALLSAFFLTIFSLIPVYFGMKAKLLGIIVPPGTSPLISVVELLTNKFVLTAALCAIIAAITSTADSLLCAISSNVSQDFEFNWLKKVNPIRRSQCITLTIGLIALAASYFVPQNIIALLIGSYELSVSCLLVPLAAIYLDKHAHPMAAWMSVVSGGIAFTVTLFWNTTFPKSFIPLAVCLASYIIGVLIEKNKRST